MRQLLVEVPQGYGKQALHIAKAHHGVNLAEFPAQDINHSVDLVVVHVSNRQVEGLIGDLQQIPDLRLTLIPRGVITLYPPASQTPQQVTNVQPLSPTEIYLSGLQSVGSWKGYVAYAIAAGVIVWIALFTNTIYLLVAAMLISPFGSPALNAAMATARGDWSLVARAFLRYGVGIGITIIVAGLLSLILRQSVATNEMVRISEISSVSVLLPLAAGAAGALHLSQSQRNSLISTAAVGVLVASSLTPPAGLIGMAAAIGKWNMIADGAFLLLLQLVGINLAGAIIFRVYGVSPHGPRYNVGHESIFRGVLVVGVVVLAGLLAWQFAQPPLLQRPTRAERASAVIQRVVNRSGVARLVQARVEFTRPNIKGQHTLLSVVYVEPSISGASNQAIRNRLTRDIQQRLLAQGFNITPLVDVVVLRPASVTRP